MIKELKDHTEFEVKQWGSHTEVIVDHIMKKHDIKWMIELGSGEFSTPVYAPRVNTLISVETNQEWLDFMKKKYPFENVEYLLLKDSEIPTWLETTFSRNVDLVLVDHTHDIENQRALVANQLMKLGCNHIVIHDLCDSIISGIDNHPDYNFFVNSKSINPSLYLARK